MMIMITNFARYDYHSISCGELIIGNVISIFLQVPEILFITN